MAANDTPEGTSPALVIIARLGLQPELVMGGFVPCRKQKQQQEGMRILGGSKKKVSFHKVVARQAAVHIESDVLRQRLVLALIIKNPTRMRERQIPYAGIGSLVPSVKAS